MERQELSLEKKSSAVLESQKKLEKELKAILNIQDGPKVQENSSKPAKESSKVLKIAKNGSKILELMGEKQLDVYAQGLKKKDNIFYEIVSSSIKFHNAFVSYKNNEYHLNKEIDQEKYSIYTLMFIENYLNTFTKYDLSDPKQILNVQEYIINYIPSQICKIVQKCFTQEFFQMSRLYLKKKGDLKETRKIMKNSMMIGPFIDRGEDGEVKSLVIRQLNVESREFAGWFLKYDSVKKILEISERLDERIVGLCLTVELQEDGTLRYEEKVRNGDKGVFKNLKIFKYCKEV